LVDLRELKDYRGVDSNGNTEANEVVRYTSPLLHAARYHLASGQQARAENAFAKVLETRRQGLDESDPDLMVAMHNLAVVHIARGELVQAHRELEDLLAAEEQYLRQDDTLILTTRALLAHLLHKLHQPARAREQWQRVLDVRLRRFGEARSSVLQVRYELALACRAVQDDEAAETQFREILSIVRNESRPEDDLSLRARHDLAALLVKRGSLKEAEELLASVLEWRTHLLGKDHPDVLPVKCELDGVRFRLGADDPGSDGDRSAQETPRSGERANRLAKKAAQILVQGAAEARQVLQELLKAKMERDPAWRHFITEQSTTGIRDKTRKWVELALADKLDEDPGLMRSVAEALPSAIAPSEQITPPESVGPAAQDRAELAPPDVAERPRAARKAALRGHVLVMATEWSSIHGGLSTFNRNLCRALAASGCVVICVVPEATDREQADAQADGVRLVSCDQLPGKPPLDRLLRRPQLPDGFRPDAVIGHGRVTGPAALSQVTDHFTTARLIHFLHVAPDEIEVFKADRERGHSESGERRTTVELDLARGADHAVAVGPRLHERYLTDLHTQKRPLRFDPGFDGGSDAIPTPPPGRPWKVLVSGRLEDAHLKGLDLAAKALGLTIRENHAELPTLELVARGAPEEEADQLAARLREWADAPSLNVVVRRYSADQEKLAMDLRQASLVLLPSRAEGFGLVGLEAIVAGIPVLVSSSSGLGNLLTEACGEEARRYVVRMTRDEAVDQDEWARKIGYMLFDREAAFSRAVALRDQLSGEGRTWANATRKLLKELHLDLRSDQVDLRESPAPAAPPPTTTSKR
jgi:glycosyltransferase involved in cell wall biosynthesis/tetratricopeptide (TPR) repeat protein